MFKEFQKLVEKEFENSTFVIISRDEKATIETYTLASKKYPLAESDVIGMVEVGKAAMLYKMFGAVGAIKETLKKSSDEKVDKEIGS